jgi:hypothetical protein
MRTAVVILAVLGIAAAVVRMVRAALWALHGGIDAFLARDTAAVRARRGDLTGLADAETQRQLARRRRIRALGAASFWAGLLLVPPLTPWPTALYASYSLLWLLPRRPALRPHP